MKPWTILFYAAADSDRHGQICSSLEAIKANPISDHAQLLAQVDHPGLEGAQRLDLSSGTELQKLGPVNTADPTTLADFLQWGRTRYPAEHTALIMMGNGGGWRGALVDYSHRSIMSLPQMEEGLKQGLGGHKLDLLAFDASQMGCAEVAYQLRDTAHYLVASEESVLKQGWPCAKMFAPLMDHDLTPAQLASSLVKGAKGDPAVQTLSALDLSQMPALANALGDFSQAILGGPEPWEKVGESWWRTHQFCQDHGHDLGDLAHQINLDRRLWDPTLRAAAGALVDQIDRTVVAETHHADYRGVRGLGVEGYRVHHSYRELALSRDTHWNEAAVALRLY